MRRIRFHLGTLVILVLLLGVGFAALRESNETCDSSIFTLTLVVLSISRLLAIHRTEERRAFCLGFAAFGSAYLVFSLVPSIESRLITTKALAFLDSKVPRSIPAADALYDIVVVNKSRPIAVDVNKGNGNLKNMAVVAGSNRLFSRILAGPSLVGFSDTTETFVRIGHSLFVLIAAFVGGQLSLHLCANHSKRTSELPSPETGFVSAEHLSGPSH